MVPFPPGSYQFVGSYKLDLLSQRGLVWRVNCETKEIGSSPLVNGVSQGWEFFKLSFTVPDDCPAQTIKLALDARSASETFVSGSIWFDDLSVVDEPNPHEVSDGSSVDNATPAGNVTPE